MSPKLLIYEFRW